MTRRRLLWAGAVLLVLLALAGLGWLLVPPDPVTQIRPGMTMEEVEAILGEPGEFLYASGNIGGMSTTYGWNRTGRRVFVHFYGQGGFLPPTESRVTQVGVSSPILFDRLRGWLGW